MTASIVMRKPVSTLKIVRKKIFIEKFKDFFVEFCRIPLNFHIKFEKFGLFFIFFCNVL